MSVDAEHLVEFVGFGGDSFGFLAGFGVFAWISIGTETFTNNGEFKIELFRKFKNHETTPENSRVMSIAVGVGVFCFDVNIGLGKSNIFIFTFGEIVRRITIAGVNHTSEIEGGRAQA